MLSKADYLAQAARRFGGTNPEQMNVAHWLEMVRTGETAYAAACHYLGDDASDRPEPGWCFDRFGMTRTRLPDGRIVCVAGEHEDYYDPDFCIYNDVVVIAADGEVSVLGYPEDVLPPTDFHTATLIGTRLILIGRLGYQGRRAFGQTPVFELDLESFAIRPLDTVGDAPGWIHRHLACLEAGAGTIRAVGGAVAIPMEDARKQYPRNDKVYRLDPQTLRWTVHEEPWRAMPVPNVVWPDGWRPIGSPDAARDLADALARSVGPDHLLFTDEYEPVAEAMNAALLRSRAEPDVWIVSEGATYCGRAREPLKYETYYGVAAWQEAAAARGKWWWH
jgi:hypothetical protein